MNEFNSRRLHHCPGWWWWRPPTLQRTDHDNYPCHCFLCCQDLLQNHEYHSFSQMYYSKIKSFQYFLLKMLVFIPHLSWHDQRMVQVCDPGRWCPDTRFPPEIQTQLSWRTHSWVAEDWTDPGSSWECGSSQRRWNNKPENWRQCLQCLDHWWIFLSKIKFFPIFLDQFCQIFMKIIIKSKFLKNVPKLKLFPGRW